MQFRSLFISFLCFLSISCEIVLARRTTSTTGNLGGWTPVDIKSEAVKKIAAFAVHEKFFGPLPAFKIVEAKKQVCSCLSNVCKPL